MQKSSSLYNSKGFSLVEIMIVSGLSLFLLALLMNIYGLTKRNYSLEQAEATIQVNANIAINLLQQDIRMAGYLGCGNAYDMTASLEKSKLKPVPEFPNSIGGSRANANVWQPDLPENIRGHVKPDTDAITLWYRKALGYPVTRRSDKIWEINAKRHPFMNNDMLLISTCRQAELLRYIADKPIQTDVLVDDEETEISQFSNYVYYISKSQYPSSNGRPVYGLFRKSLVAENAHAQELVEGVEAMRVAYGIKSTLNAGLVFLKASQVKHWSEVKIVRIHLLLSSIEEVLDKPQSYQFDGEKYTPHDRMLRKEWVSYVYLRQR